MHAAVDLSGRPVPRLQRAAGAHADRRTSTSTCSRSSSAPSPSTPRSRCTSPCTTATTSTTSRRPSFKAVGRALAEATRLNPRIAGVLPSTKGSLWAAVIADRRLRAGQSRQRREGLRRGSACRAVVTEDPRVVDEAEAVVLPGDGAFHDAMANLGRRSACSRRVRARLDGERPFLGICLGYQLLFSESEEFGEGRGLDVIPGAVRRFPARGLKVPHMGWNRVEHGGDLRAVRGRPERRALLLRALVLPGRPHDTAAQGGDVRLRRARSPPRSSAGALYATQFHPEKSQRWGSACSRTSRPSCRSARRCHRHP